MKKTQKAVNYLEKAFANAALKVGIASVNSACRFSFYQNEIPVKMMKYNRHMCVKPHS